MASNVPKFTSFRPKPKVPAEASKEPRRLEKPRTSDNTRRSKEKARHKNDSLPGYEDERYGKESASRSKNEDQQRSHVRDAEPSNLFFSDRRGDPDIVKYGSLNIYDIPAYRSYGYGCILGLPLDKRIDRDRSTDKEIVVIPARRHQEERLLVKKNTEKGGSRNVRFLKTMKETQDVGDDFIPISTTGKRKREEKEDENHAEDDYRGFEEKRSDTKPSDSDAEYESETLVSYEDTEATRRNSELVRRTHEHPEDVQAWFDLADHQEAMMKIDRLSSELSSSDKQHLADVRISTYEHALRKIGKDQDGVAKLYGGLMSEATRSWDEGRLTRKWAEILTKFPRNGGLWTQYLNFVQSSFTGFKYEGCRAAFFTCLHTIRTDSPQTSVEFLLYVLVRLTSMIQQAGYQELAIAAWQALLEFHLLQPKSIDGRENVHLFEEFWESEEPRIGEVSAKGWSASNSDDAPSKPMDADTLDAYDPSHSIFRDFCKRELDSTVKLRYPGRATDEVGEDDAFHTVLYSDIEELLRIVPQGTSKVLVLSTFLRFCRLPTLLGTALDDQDWSSDPFLQYGFEKSDDQDKSTHFSQSLARYANCPLDAYQMTIELLFDRGFPEAMAVIDAAFIRRVLTVLVTDVNCDECIGEYLLAFESKYFAAEAFKTAKKLLKARPSSLRLYNAYGLVESRCGNPTKADRVFSAALSMQKGGKPLSTPGALDLFANWVWEALRRGDHKEALWRLVSPTGQVSKTLETPGYSALLRSRSVLSDTNERALLGNDHYTAIKATSLLALLGYLSGGEDAENALAVHNTLSTWFAQRSLSQSPAAELHAQSIAQLLIHHANHAPIVKPFLLRTILEPFIKSFPNNTILLSLFAANEARFSIDDRVRAIMHQNILSNARGRSIVGWTFAIHYEKLRGEIAGSTSHSIRALFRKAEDDAGAHCPVLWRQHVLFELEEAAKERVKRPNKKPRRDGKKRKEESRVEEAYRRVKETFFKGMTQLPWCKDYIMMAFTHLGEEFLSGEELRKVYNVMVEKELRLYVELQDDGT